MEAAEEGSLGREGAELPGGILTWGPIHKEPCPPPAVSYFLPVPSTD